LENIMNRRTAIAIVFLGLGAPSLTGQEAWRTALHRADELRKERRFAEAERAFQTALDEARHLEQDWVPAATVYHNLAGLYQDMGSCDLAVRAYQRSIDLWKKAGAPGEPYLFRTANDLVALYLGCGAVRDAERQYDALVAPAIAARAGCDRDPDCAKALGNRGAIAFARRRYPEARKWYEEALAIRQRIASEPTEPPGEIAILWNNIALTLLRSGDLDQALAFSRRSVAALESTAQAAPRLLVSALLNNAGIYLRTPQWAEAQPLLDRALAVAQSLGTEHPLTAAVMTSYAAMLKKAHRNKEAAVMKSRVRELSIRSFHGAARQTVDVQEFPRLK
jgi:tetratricopeptide (TPR) repeat protein